jgi:hypothetical protein
MKRIAAFSLFLMLFAACSDRNSIRINGNFKNSNHEKIYLDRIDVNTILRIDSAKIRKNGNFRFKLNATEPEFYQLGFSQSDFISILAEPGEKIKLNFKGKTLFENYEVEGSDGTEKIKKLDLVLAETKRKIDSLRTVYDSASKSPGFELKEPQLNNEYIRLIKEQRSKSIQFILGNLNSFASIKALYQRIDENTSVFYEGRDLQFFKLVSDSLNYHFPNSKQAKALKKDFEKGMNQFFLNQIESAAKNAPELKLDPDLKDINGKRVVLSSLRGKYVLLTFWTSKSDQCVAENLTLKAYYKKYHSKGFEIYQVSLDENETAWKNAVKFDELPWISVREDNPANPVNAKLFNVQELPANYFFDKNGIIVAKDLHERNLQIKLVQLFGN